MELSDNDLAIISQALTIASNLAPCYRPFNWTDEVDTRARAIRDCLDSERVIARLYPQEPEPRKP